LAGIAALNLLWPTALPLRANGVPLNRLVEFWLLSVFVGWLVLLAGVAVLKNMGLSLKPAPRLELIGRAVSVTAVAVGGILFVLRLTSPPNGSFDAAYTTPERPRSSALFLTDSWYRRSPGASRYEEQIMFGPSTGQTWRLGLLNDSAFNVIEGKPGTLLGRRLDFRENNADPFRASFTYGPAIASGLAGLFPQGADLWITYRGAGRVLTQSGATDLPFSTDEQSRAVPVALADFRSLRLDYANFTCPDAACLADLTMKPVPIPKAVFEVRIAPPGATQSAARPLSLFNLAGADIAFHLGWWSRILELVVMVLALGRLGLWLVSLLLGIRLSVRTWALAAATIVPAILVQLGAVEQAFFLAFLPVGLGASLIFGVLPTEGRPAQAREGLVVPVLIGISSLLLAGVQAPESIAGISAGALGARSFLGASNWLLPAWDHTALFAAGDDPLTYASWAKLVLQTPQRMVDASVVFSKPFFVYFRALYFMLFGDGDVYASAMARNLLFCALALSGTFLLYHLARRARRADANGVCDTLLMLAATWAWGWLCYSVARDGVNLATGQFSEGITWTLTLTSFGLLVAAVSAGSSGLSLASGTVFALAVMMRTTVSPLILLGLGVLYLASTACWRAFWRPAVAYLSPLVAAAALIWLHAGAPLTISPEVAAYWKANTGLAHSLIPAAEEELLLALAVVAVVVAAIGVGSNRQRLGVGAVALAIVVGVFVPVLPQLAAPYYPRQLMLQYYMLATVPALLLVGLRHERAWSPPAFAKR